MKIAKFIIYLYPFFFGALAYFIFKGGLVFIGCVVLLLALLFAIINTTSEYNPKK